MTILFDENVPRRLRKFLHGHVVRTVQEMGWQSIKNGELLKKADGIFDVFVTVDKDMQYQQNFSGKKICFITLMSKYNNLNVLIPLVPELLRQLSLLTPGSGTVINILPP